MIFLYQLHQYIKNNNSSKFLRKYINDHQKIVNQVKQNGLGRDRDNCLQEEMVHPRNILSSRHVPVHGRVVS